MGDSIDDISIIVLGSLNTDIFGVGVERMLKPGELSFGGEARIGAGGKSRNIAQMTATLLGKGTVAMIGRTSKDPYELWKIPIIALENSGVNTKYIKRFHYDECGKMPGIALIPVDKKGENQIYVLPGINEDFCPEDVEDAKPLFEKAKKNKGLVALTLEMPMQTARYAIQTAHEYELPVFLDAGGIREGGEYDAILREAPHIHLIKMNQHEASILAKVPTIKDYHKTTIATRNLRDRGAENILITMGEKGAYLFTSKATSGLLIRPPNIQEKVQNTAGCGDQTMAGILYAHMTGKTIEESTNIGITAGTIQAYKTGITPVTKEEIEKFM